ncbi:MAG: hypothetical protein QXM12_05500 [Nitrososphaerota archaeon]
MSTCDLLVRHFNFSPKKPCKFWVRVEGKASRCLLDGSVPICCGNWCEDLGPDLYVVICDKLKEVARNVVYAIRTGIDDIDLTLKGGLIPPVHAAFIGNMKNIDAFFEHLLTEAAEKRYMCVKMSSGTLRVPIGEVQGVIFRDLNSFYDGQSVFQQLSEISRLERSSLERGFQGLLVAFNNLLYLASTGQVSKVMFFEEQLEKMRSKFRKTIVLCLYDKNSLDKIRENFILNVHSLVAYIEEPLKVKVLKAGS